MTTPAWLRSTLLLRAGSILCAALAVSACSVLPSWMGGASKKNEPKPLPPVTATFDVAQVWSAQIGAVSFPLVAHVRDNTVWLAADNGTVAAIDASSGADIWRIQLKERIAAGVGSDGKVTAVITTGNRLVAIEDGQQTWQQELPSQTYTPPLVAGGRIFVLAADRSVNAFDAHNGRQLWKHEQPEEPLVLRQAGVLLPVGNMLVAGLSGRLSGLDPDNGTLVWQAPVASPRGTNDVERLVDLVAPASRLGDSVCVRAFQTSVGCVDTQTGHTIWSKSSNGARGVAGDEAAIYGTASNGSVQAWSRASGDATWSNDALLYRELSAPLVLGRSVIIGDDSGLLHFLSRSDGSIINRLNTDGSPIAVAPVVAANTLVIVTAKGRVYGFRPQ